MHLSFAVTSSHKNDEVGHILLYLFNRQLFSFGLSTTWVTNSCSRIANLCTILELPTKNAITKNIVL